jgi:predicted 2-oxoglutarate/Fe(II)-dependent dioxygenase YbiX
MTREDLDGDLVFVIRDFLSPQECAAALAVSEQAGYDDAPITTAAGMVMRKDVRNNDRVMIDDPGLAALLFERARPFLVPRWRGHDLLGFNERFRYYRYKPGQYFAPHYDGAFQRDNGDLSFFTFMVYLNEFFDGGTTNFLDRQPPLVVRPAAGLALVFYHRQLHEGEVVVSGTKYVLRTDVMYRWAQG